MTLRKILSVLICLLMAASFCACNQIGDNTPDNDDPVQGDTAPVREPYPISVYGVTFEDAPTKAVSLSPAITQMLTHIDAVHQLVGISEYCSLPGYELETAGSPANPDIEKLIELAPEIVLTLSPIASTDKINLSQYGITVVEIPEPESYGELCDIYIALSKIFYGNVDSKDIAYDALESIDSALTQAKEAGISRQFLCVAAVHGDGLTVLGEGTLESDLLSVFGDNVMKSEGVGYADEEILKLLEPSVIFAYDSVDRDDIRDYFEDAKIIFIPEESFSQPSAALSNELLAILEELK